MFPRIGIDRFHTPHVSLSDEYNMSYLSAFAWKNKWRHVE
jgi:hypothetical protein